MAARTQTSFYPAKTREEVCKACYVSGESDSCRPNFGNAQNSSLACADCNIECNTAQAYCSIGYESITSHGDVGSFSGFGAKAEDMIYKVWTKDKWNELQDDYLTANAMGQESSQGGSFSFSSFDSGVYYTAAKYNEFSKAASAFSSSTPEVKAEDLIKVSHSTALETGFSNGKFGSSVCDICNAGTQHNCGYNCSCNYNCSYNCQYNCSYNCHYNCCNHQCSSNKPAT